MQFADVPVSLSQCEGAVFGGFHQLALAGAFVVEAAEVEYAVDDDAVELLVVRLAECLINGFSRCGATFDVVTCSYLPPPIPAPRSSRAC